MRARTRDDGAPCGAYSDAVTLPRFICALVLGLALFAASPAMAKSNSIVINRRALSASQVQHLERMVGARLSAGRYWYDARSGAWGLERGPMQGILPAGLPIPAPLWRQASNGHTGVIVNGRELHRADVQRLVAAGVPVRRGRYWLNANGIGGYEGGPAAFNLKAMLQSRRSGGRKSILSTYDRTGVAVF